MKMMREFLSSESKWAWLLALALVSLLALGIAFLPTALVRQYEFVERMKTPAGLYILSLFNLALMIGVLVSLVLERFERPMVILFVAFRIGATAWEFVLGRHSEWYLIVTAWLSLLVGAAVLLFLSHHIQRRDLRRGLSNGEDEDRK